MGSYNWKSNWLCIVTNLQWVWAPSEYLASDFIPSFQHLCHACKHCWIFSESLSGTVVTLCKMYSSNTKQDPYKEIFSFGNVKKSHWSKLGKCNGCSKTGIYFLAKLKVLCRTVHYHDERYLVFFGQMCCCKYSEAWGWKVQLTVLEEQIYNGEFLLYKKFTSIVLTFDLWYLCFFFSLGVSKFFHWRFWCFVSGLHLVLSSKNVWSHTFTPPIRLHGVVLS